jgi:phage gp46-like protein
MTIALVFDNEKGFADLAFADSGTLLTDDGLESAVTISLFSDRRAPASEVADPTERRGWWGDTYPDVPEDLIGSLLWLLGKAKSQDSAIEIAKGFAEDALRWLLDDGVAATVLATPFFLEDHPLRPLCIRVEIARPETPAVRWIRTWDATTARLL